MRYVNDNSKLMQMIDAWLIYGAANIEIKKERKHDTLFVTIIYAFMCAVAGWKSVFHS